MRAPKVEELRAPPKIGSLYSVRCVNGRIHDMDAMWPILGDRHADRELSAIVARVNGGTVVPRAPGMHYHADWRFVAPRLFDQVLDYGSVHGITIHRAAGDLWGASVGRLEIVRRRRKCHRDNEIHTPDSPVFKEWEAGLGLRLDTATMICPHKAIPLGSEPVVDGVVTCPGHFLRFCVATGKHLKRAEMPACAEVARVGLQRVEPEARR